MREVDQARVPLTPDITQAMVFLNGLQAQPVASKATGCVGAHLISKRWDAVPVATKDEPTTREEQRRKVIAEEGLPLLPLTRGVRVDQSTFHALKREVQALQPALRGVMVGFVTDAHAWFEEDGDPTRGRSVVVPVSLA